MVLVIHDGYVSGDGMIFDSDPDPHNPPIALINMTSSS